MNPEALLVNLNEGRRLIAALLDSCRAYAETEEGQRIVIAANACQALVGFLIAEVKDCNCEDDSAHQAIQAELSARLETLREALGAALNASHDKLQGPFLTRLSYFFATMLSLSAADILTCAAQIRADVDLNTRLCLLEQDLRDKPSLIHF